ncbi:Heterokaryon incompatibility protein 6, OR allele-like protein [Hapsidospora chrysogenum ATCC 11550]|uniref:Heterokaryon incompatibility protein 6, OR allele-like protein n=1 Tax=Hapsidospora chrysogenum (strain ATCC 11550 / CBS 779.69 / DSM 880 / IAM 14645 / JCM 23072 / IMI 49137) TaxID=857340 RepID=A0A086TCK8_HAPC1|nr:Heterokaryon incompatibility protein 6, OR allele-like protein [Hapsidospora chrysogenum ATCC 11550]
MGAALSRAWSAVSGRWLAPRPSFEFHYALDNHSIRLLRFVAPREYRFDPMATSLLATMHRLDDLAEYVAWPYTWPPTPRMTDTGIWSSSARQRATAPRPSESHGAAQVPSLHWYFNDDVRHVWIDAICTNQADVEKRAAQGGIMDRIYRGAFSTAIWLGKETSDSDKAKANGQRRLPLGTLPLRDR